MFSKKFLIPRKSLLVMDSGGHGQFFMGIKEFFSLDLIWIGLSKLEFFQLSADKIIFLERVSLLNTQFIF